MNKRYVYLTPKNKIISVLHHVKPSKRTVPYHGVWSRWDLSGKGWIYSGAIGLEELKRFKLIDVF